MLRILVANEWQEYTGYHRGMNSGEFLDESTSESLIRRAQRADSAAWDQLARLYSPMVYGWARRSGLSPDDAADLMQNVFATIASRLHQFEYRNQSDRFRGWLYTVTRNKVTDHFRKLQEEIRAAGGTHARQVLNELPEAAPARDSDDGRAELSGLRERALEQISGDFSSRTWQAFWRTAVKKDSPQDVAEDLGISVWAVYKARSRVLAKLRSEFQDLL